MSPFDPHARDRAAVAALSVAALAALAGAGSAAPAAELSASVTPRQLTIGTTLTVNGSFTVEGRGAAGVALALQGAPYPSNSFTTLARTHSDPGGGFSFAGIPTSRNTGIPPVARPRWQVFFKTGQIPSKGLYNEVARLERPGRTVTLAVLTTGDPSMAYGRATIAGVARRLLWSSP